MKITLIDYTKNAEDLLILAKSTRLKMSPNLLEEIKNMSKEDKLKEIDYIFGTIQGSLEFVDYTFIIEDVTRAFTHQLVRHRIGTSFAQQSMRTVNMENFEYLASGDCSNDLDYHNCMNTIKHTYNDLIKKGVKPEDARGILPTNILTNIIMKINLRALSEMMKQRLCYRTQEEFRKVVIEIKKIIRGIHPWTIKVLRCYCNLNEKCFFKNGKGCGMYESD